MLNYICRIKIYIKKLGLCKNFQIPAMFNGFVLCTKIEIVKLLFNIIDLNVFVDAVVLPNV